MKRFLFIVLIAVAVSGCASVNGRLVVFSQRGIVLNLIHDCTNQAKLFGTGNPAGIDVVGATPFEIGIQPVRGGDDIHVTIQSIDTSGKISGTYSMSFDTYGPTGTRTWIISKNFQGGRGRHVYHSRCQ